MIFFEGLIARVEEGLEKKKKEEKRKKLLARHGMSMYGTMLREL